MSINLYLALAVCEVHHLPSPLSMSSLQHCLSRQQVCARKAPAAKELRIFTAAAHLRLLWQYLPGSQADAHAASATAHHAIHVQQLLKKMVWLRTKQMDFLSHNLYSEANIYRGHNASMLIFSVRTLVSYTCPPVRHCWASRLFLFLVADRNISTKAYSATTSLEVFDSENFGWYLLEQAMEWMVVFPFPNLSLINTNNFFARKVWS